jgi:hypothetical protein
MSGGKTEPLLGLSQAGHGRRETDALFIIFTCIPIE